LDYDIEIRILNIDKKLPTHQPPAIQRLICAVLTFDPQLKKNLNILCQRQISIKLFYLYQRLHRHDIAKILLKVALSTNNQSINQSKTSMQRQILLLNTGVRTHYLPYLISEIST
jgi:hypothetical protein